MSLPGLLALGLAGLAGQLHLGLLDLRGLLAGGLRSRWQPEKGRAAGPRMVPGADTLARASVQVAPAACPCGLPGQSGISSIATWPRDLARADTILDWK